MKIPKLLKVFKRNKSYALDASSKVELATKKVDNAFEMFKQAQSAIDESNEELKIAMREAEHDEIAYKEKAKERSLVRERAQDHINMNNKLSERIRDFLV